MTYQCAIEYAQHICNIVMSTFDIWINNLVRYHYIRHMQSLFQKGIVKNGDTYFKTSYK